MKTAIAIIWATSVWLILGFSFTNAADDKKAEVLAVVNGDTVTSSDLEAMIIQVHADMDRDRKMSFDYRKLLDKLINDRLIIQEAVSLGLNEENWLIEELVASRQTNAIRYFVRDAFQPDLSVSDAELESFFREYYSKLQVRTISVAQTDEAQRLLEAIKSGADMDSIAQAVSLDTYRYQGGLHKLKYYADVENELRDQVASLQPGQMSDVFPYRQVYSFLRLEQTVPFDMNDLPQFSKKIKSILTARKQEAAWKAFVDSLALQYPIKVDSAVLRNIAGDAALLFTGDFVKGEDVIALSVDTGNSFTDAELRKTVSRTAMEAGDQPFETILFRGLAIAREELVLRAAALHGDYYENPEVVERYDKSLDSALIEIYLQETIVPRIRFSHAEFEEYYNGHQDDFREPDRFQLDRLEVADRATADEIVARLAEGADFEYLGRQYGAKTGSEDDRNQWITLDAFPASIRPEIEQVKVGQTTSPFQSLEGWMVFRIRSWQQGEVKKLADVDMEIRQLMFQKKFNELLDETIGVLKENSDIQYNQKALEAYFEEGS